MVLRVSPAVEVFRRFSESLAALLRHPEALILLPVVAPSCMVRVGSASARDIKAGLLRRYMISRKRAKASSRAMREFQLSWFQSQSAAVLMAMALSEAGEKKDRRVIPRALGKWRGSTLSGYLTHPDPADDRRASLFFRRGALCMPACVVLGILCA